LSGDSTTPSRELKKVDLTLRIGASLVSFVDELLVRLRVAAIFISRQSFRG